MIKDIKDKDMHILDLNNMKIQLILLIKVLKYKSDLNPDFQLSMFEESVKKSI